ncbi:BBP7 family outer membrane beta-barrel protein [Rubripirellula amarantea]|nr:BBP7 family outer membrane beta-barrel protein [Rubripirellula amarantea]
MKRNTKMCRNGWGKNASRMNMLLAIAIAGVATASTVHAQVRTKRPDRGTYRSPEMETLPLDTVELEPPTPMQDTENASTNLRRVAHENVQLRSLSSMTPLVDDANDDAIADSDQDRHGVPVSYESYEVIQDDGQIIYDEGYAHYGGEYCDDAGCDSMGGACGWANSKIRLSRCDWFGSLELLTMFRNGDRLPELVTTGPAEATADAQVLAGGETLLKDITVGGRLTLGTWLDDSQCRSLVFRGWGAAEESYHFSRDQTQTSILGRPFFDVTDDETPGDNVQIIASPGRANGSINVDATSNVFGGDVSVRQYLYGAYGGTVDVLYGYQYMRLNEDLRIGSSILSLDEDFAPVGTIIESSDAFEAENDFHGGQLGIATKYREGSWSFSGLAKAGFGSLRRTATRTGATVTRNGGLSSPSDQGLLVRNTNSGKTTDHTFGWVPELDFTIGYQRFPSYELTVGYHIIAMTDALQTSGTIDPNLATNLADNPTGTQSPSPDLRFDTFYVQGIHFGIQYVY